MFGYVNPDKPNMLMKDYALYRAYYCGVCKTTGKVFGQTSRFATNYDIAFFAALIHDCTNFFPEIYQGACVLNPVKKKDIVKKNSLMERISAINLIMFYYKLRDDAGDKGRGGAARAVFVRAYKKAKALLPEFDAKVSQQYSRLREYEKQGNGTIDVVADCSALMLAEACKAAVDGEPSEHLVGLCYNVGKWVYLADALDDICEDYKSGNYNPLLTAFPHDKTAKAFDKQSFVQENRAELDFLFNTVLNAAAECLKNLPAGHSSSLLDNVVFRGLPQKTKAIMSSPTKLKKVNV